MLNQGQSSLIARAEALADQMVAWRRTIHENPELSFHEHATAAFVASLLHKIDGVRVETGVGGGTGVVATLGTGTGPVIALRADMDALPIFEENTHGFASRNSGVMHACGHDAHTAILLGAVHVLADAFRTDDLQGTVRCIFQPAEEAADEQGLTGAVHMIQAGVLDGVSAAMALHMNPERPLGEVWVHTGYSMANVDNFRAVITGSGGHAAYPHLTTDPTWLLGPVLQALHGIVARRVSPLEPAVVSVGQIHAGATNNVIATEVRLEGTLRSYHPAVRELLIQELERAFSVARALGGDYELEVTRGEPALINSALVNQAILASVQALYPDCRVSDIPFGLGGEDFGHMSQQVPAAMFFLGCGLSDGVARGLHTPIFDLDERCLPMGVGILVDSARRLLEPTPS